MDNLIFNPSIEGSLLNTEQFLREVKNRWDSNNLNISLMSEEWPIDVNVVLYYKSKICFNLDHFRDNKTISCDGNMEQVISIALWIRSLFSEDVPIWLSDGDFSAHVVIKSGMNYNDVMNGWIDHSEHDPFEEYPEYFGSG